MKTLIEMAREAGFSTAHTLGWPECYARFAELVRADEREICSALDFRKEIGLTSEQDYKVSQLILFGGST